MITPLKMKENRVWRLYYGGKLIDEMRKSGNGEKRGRKGKRSGR